MTRIYIIEDNSAHLELLQLKAESLGYEVVGFSQKTTNVLLEIKKKNPDVILMDINFNGNAEGIKLAHEINEFIDVAIIFITSQTKNEIISAAVSANPTGYLVKPVDPIDLKANIELAMHQRLGRLSAPNQHQEFLSIRTGQKLQIVQFTDIKYLLVDTKNYVTVVDLNNKMFAIRNSLKNVLTEMLPSTFVRTHHGYAINLDFVAYIDEKEQTIHLKSDDAIPIGKTYRKLVYEKLNVKT